MKSYAFDITELSRFILVARNSFLNGQENTPLENLNTHEATFSEGEMVYHRSYMGIRTLIGREIVFLNEQPIWGLSFMGTAIQDDLEPKKILRFLNIFLLLTYPKDKISSEQNGYKFDNVTDGDITHFNGELSITSEKDIVFKFHYFGGMIIGNHPE